MQNVFGVSRGQSRAELSRNFQRFVGREPADAPQKGSQVFAIDILHGEKRVPVDLPDVINAANIGMRNSPCHSHFVAKAFQQSLIAGGFVGKKLHSDRLSERQIIRTIDLAHAAFSK
jgi:hypothetical protein